MNNSEMKLIAMAVARVCHKFQRCETNVRTHHYNLNLAGTLPPAGGRLNKKDGFTRYGDSHVKDKTS